MSGAALNLPSPASPISAPAVAGRILVVDDDPQNRALLSAVLRRAGFEVVLATRGTEALAVTQTFHPDLVLLDFMMPGMSGPEVLARLRARPWMKDIPILMLTASSRDEHIEESLGGGADDYLLKPIDPRILRARVTSALRARADRRRAEQATSFAVEMSEAREVQQAQLPALPLAWPGYRAMGAVVPCGEVGGDVFDVVEGYRGHRVALLIDVCGHGVAAALAAAFLHADLRALLHGSPVEEALAQLNEQLLAQSAPRYACVAAVELGDHEITVVNAGLPPICVGRAGAVRAAIQGSGVPPGLFPGERYERTRLRLDPGERVALMSDGVTEPFGLADDVTAAVRALRLFEGDAWTTEDPLSAEERVQHWMRKAPTEARDDATLLLLEATG